MRTTTVLIVEDEALIAAELRDHLEQAGHTVVGAVDTVDAALAAVRAHPPGVVLLDVRLKGDEDGIDAAVAIQDLAAVPVVFVTAHSDDVTLHRAMLAQPYGYVVKPVTGANVLAAVQTALVRRNAEDYLRADEDQFRAMLDRSADLTLRALPNGRLIAANRACRAALGYSSAKICQLTFLDLIVEADHDAVGRAVEKAGAGESTSALAVTLVAADGRTVPVSGAIGSRSVGGKIDGVWAIFSRTDGEPATEKRL